MNEKMPPPNKERPLFMALSSLENTCQELDEHLATLGQRLSCLVAPRPEPPKSAPASMETRAMTGGVTERMTGLAGILQRLVTAVRDLHESIEV